MKIMKASALMALCPLLALAQDDPYNPNPSKDDVVVSMPCGARMAFVKVYTSPDADRLRDRQFRSGISDSESPFAQNPVSSYIQGGFKDKNGYYYLMGKYEVMQRQHDALSGKCKEGEPSKRELLPVVGVSWFDAMNDARAYSDYLQTAKDAPASGSAKGFARLPTDAQWEFAARGGLKVSSSQFEAKLPPMEGELRDYAWFQGAKSSNGRLNLPGRLKPNPLGIYDMFGNAAEMVLDPFSANRTGRHHGQDGGMTVRGGSFLTPEASITSALRTEKPYFVGGSELKSKDLGFRLAIGTVVATDANAVKSLNDEVSKLGNEETTGSAKGDKDGTVARLNGIIEKNRKAMESVQKEKNSLEQNNEMLEKNNSELTSELEKLREQMVDANASRDEMRDVAITANLRLGGFLCRTMTDEYSTQQYFEKAAQILKTRCKDGTESFCKSYNAASQSAEKSGKALGVLATYYGDTLTEAANTYDLKLFERQLASSKTAMANTNFSGYIDMYYSHLKGFRKMGSDMQKNQAAWIKQCHSLVEGKK
ncbi:MAG: SUMF1/EgtB/PvdO family nonheme iron enzyme [Succinivibrio sp.]